MGLDNDEDAEVRAQAAETLFDYGSPAAVPALRRALEKVSEEGARAQFIEALYQSGGISDEEAAAALEAYARKMIAPGGEQEISGAQNGEAKKPLPLNVSIGRVIHESDTLKATEGLTARLFERIRQLRRTNLPLAKQLLLSIQNVPLPLADQFFAERLGDGWLDTDDLQLALDRQDTLQKHAGETLARLAYGEGYAAGIATAVLENYDRAGQLLKGQDRAAQKALLAAARYLRLPLPVETVSPLLKEKLLADYAEAYLIIEDSRAARELVWARHPREALILGTSSFELFSAPNEPFDPYEPLPIHEKKWIARLQAPRAPSAIYGVLATK